MNFSIRDLYEKILEEITFTNMIIILFYFIFLTVLLEDELLFLFASQAR